jgi:hypothetical protein
VELRCKISPWPLPKLPVGFFPEQAIFDVQAAPSATGKRVVVRIARGHWSVLADISPEDATRIGYALIQASSDALAKERDVAAAGAERQRRAGGPS